MSEQFYLVDTGLYRYVAHLARTEDFRNGTACGEPWQPWQTGDAFEQHTPRAENGDKIRACRACQRAAFRDAP